MRTPMLHASEIHSLTDFLRNHKAHVSRLKETHAPEVLTVNGKAEVVVQDAASYQIMLDRLHTWKPLRPFRKACQARNAAN